MVGVLGLPDKGFGNTVGAVHTLCEASTQTGVDHAIECVEGRVTASVADMLLVQQARCA